MQKKNLDIGTRHGKVNIGVNIVVVFIEKGFVGIAIAAGNVIIHLFAQNIYIEEKNYIKI